MHVESLTAYFALFNHSLITRERFDIDEKEPPKRKTKDRERLGDGKIEGNNRSVILSDVVCVYDLGIQLC